MYHRRRVRFHSLELKAKSDLKRFARIHVQLQMENVYIVSCGRVLLKLRFLNEECLSECLFACACYYTNYVNSKDHCEKLALMRLRNFNKVEF